MSGIVSRRVRVNKRVNLQMSVLASYDITMKSLFIITYTFNSSDKPKAGFIIVTRGISKCLRSENGDGSSIRQPLSGF